MKPQNPLAFPRPAGPYISSEEGCANESEKGMTLRDYFAGQALHALGFVVVQPEGGTSAELAELSYQIADAMLAERSKVT